MKSNIARQQAEIKILFLLVLFLMTPSPLFAQDHSTETIDKNDNWLKKEEINLKTEINNYNDQTIPEETLEFHTLTDPFSQEYDLNDMIKEKMAWDKNIPFKKSNPQKCRLSFGIIKLNQVMGGALVKVRLFN
jgi:hypothetical protein